MCYSIINALFLSHMSLAASCLLAFTQSIPRNTRTIHPLKGVEVTSLRLTSVVPEELTDQIKKSEKSKKKKSRTLQKKAVKTKNSNMKQVQKKRKQNRSFKPLKDLNLGSIVSGNVVETCDFGAFVDIGFASRGSRPGTALLHISQIQDTKIDNIDDVVKKGDTIKEARVIKIDYVKGEVGISLRNAREKRKDISEFRVRDKLVGRVDTVLPYGAFIDVGANVNPLLHISRITGSAIENIRHYINEGDSVPVHLIDIDVEKKTMAVSMLDMKADQYLDRRLSQKKRKSFGTARESVPDDVNDESELDYFDKAIQELEAALKDR